MLKIGLPKGKVIDRSRALVRQMIGQEIDDKQLHFRDDNRQVDFYLLKHRDIPGLVADGTLNAGITAEEWVAESGESLETVKELDWNDTRVSLLTSHGSRLGDSDKAISCVTEFPKLAEDFFRASGRKNYTIRRISGSSEGLVPSIYDCVVDCVETGATAQLHGLVEEQVLLQSKTVLVVLKEVTAELNHLIKEWNV